MYCKLAWKRKRSLLSGLKGAPAVFFDKLRITLFKGAGKLALFLVCKVYAQIQKDDTGGRGECAQKRYDRKPLPGVGDDGKNHYDKDADCKGDGSADKSGIFVGLLFFQDSVHLRDLFDRISAFADISQKYPGKSAVVGKLCHVNVLLVSDEWYEGIHILEQNAAADEKEQRKQKHEGVSFFIKKSDLKFVESVVGHKSGNYLEHLLGGIADNGPFFVAGEHVGRHFLLKLLRRIV